MDTKRLLQLTSRTFAIGIQALPNPLREQVRTAYLLLRVSDYLEDVPSLDRDTKVALLKAWASCLRGERTLRSVQKGIPRVDDAIPDAAAVSHLPEILSDLRSLEPGIRDIVVRYVVASTLGMRRWQVRGSIFETEADLDDYMHEVAGRVGHLLTDLFIEWEPSLESQRAEMRKEGRHFGLGLQTVNVIRGLHEDHLRGWTFIPQSFAAERQADVSSIVSAEHTVQLEVLHKLIQKALWHLDHAITYIQRVPRRHRGIRIFCCLPLFFARATLRESRQNSMVFEEEVKISRAEVKRISLLTRLFSSSNTWISWYSDRLSS